MKKRPTLIAAGVAALALLAAGSTALGHDQKSAAAGEPTRLAAATLIIEVNGTDGDAGLQFFLDGEPWNSMTISDPIGNVVVDVDAEGRLRDWGLTELFSESNEPPFSEVPLGRVQGPLPQGQVHLRRGNDRGRKAHWHSEALPRHSRPARDHLTRRR